MRRQWIIGGLALLFLSGCGSNSDDGGASQEDFGGKPLSTLDEACEGVTGLTGQVILDQKTDAIAATLGYVTASGQPTSPSALTLDLTWPASPVATCYPKYQKTGLQAEARVAIEGISMHFTTADGQFDETLQAKAWIQSQGGVAGLTTVVAATSRSALHGTWKPFSDYDNGGGTLWFVNRLYGANSSQAGGNVGLGSTSLGAIGAGLFGGGNAVALWPTPP
jgi:hypothetical protein